MMQDDSILEPLDMYNNQLKDIHNENTEKYFDDLVEKSGIDVEENRETVKKYKATLAEAENAAKKEKNARRLRGFVIFLTVISLIVGVASIYLFTQDGSLGSLSPTLTLVIGIILVVLGIGFIVLICLKLNKMVKERKKYKEIKEKEAQELKDLCWSQMAPLNALYDWNMSTDLVKQTTPLINLDKYFDGRKLQYLMEKYGLVENTDPTCSTYFVQSGTIVGNPFIIHRTFNQNWVNQVYTGHLTIHWTTTERDSNGRTVTKHHTQTLTATVTKPKPNYFYDTELMYLNDAAPDLIFNRTKSGINSMNDKEIDKYIKKGEKELEKMSQKAIKEGGKFQKMVNGEFDVLFGATDRNDEIQYRLLFTPLAQRNMVKLLRTKEPYGDDFDFSKYLQLNLIRSDHSQNFNYYGDPKKYISYDYDISRNTFIDYNNTYFKGIFFDLAPILSIPLYQQHQPEEYIYGDTYGSNVASYEQEAMSNSYDPDEMKHPNSITDVINKTQFIGKVGDADRVLVSSHSFYGEERVDYIPVRGGDGYYHDVPVPWIEYLPLLNQHEIIVKPYASSRPKFNNDINNGSFGNFANKCSTNNSLIYERGLLSFLSSGAYSGMDSEELDAILNNKGE